MSRDDMPADDAAQVPFSNPWPPLGLGIAATMASVVWFEALRYPAVPLVVAGLLASGAAVAIRPKSRVVLGLATLTGLFAYAGLSWDENRGGTDWDSARLLVLVL